MFERRLATFLHISDLHFGDMNPNQNNGTYDANAPKFWKYLKVFQGLMGHTTQAMAHLADFFDQLVDSENAQLLITGDLTCTGKCTQFALARDFLGHEVTFPGGNSYGLFCPIWKERCIGGNHDQWNGAPPMLRGGISKAYHHITMFPPNTFPRMAPDFEVSLSDRRKLRVRFAMVDSDADVATHWMSGRRIRARGKFASQLQSQAIDMGNRGPDEIRALLIHHSPTVPMLNSTLRMHAACRDALDQYLFDQEISVVMTGHIHVPKIRVFLARDQRGSGQTRRILEARSGTATQRDEIPPNWRATNAQWRNWQLEQNVVLVHRLWEIQAAAGAPAVAWEVTAYWRDRGGFVLFGGVAPIRVPVWP